MKSDFLPFSQRSVREKGPGDEGKKPSNQLTNSIISTVTALCRTRFIGLVRLAKPVTAAHSPQLKLLLAVDAAVIAFTNTRIVQANRAAADLLGTSPAQLESMPLQAVIHPNERESFMQRCVDASCTMTVRAVGGQLLSITVHPVPDSAVFVATLKRQPDSVPQEITRLRGILDTTAAMIWRFLPDKRFTISFANATIAAHYNTTPEAMVGQSIYAFLPESDYAQFLHHMNLLTPQQPSSSNQIQARRPDGSVRWHQWHDTAFFDAQGRVTEYQSVGTDITTQKRAEARLGQRIALTELLNDLLRRFVEVDSSTALNEMLSVLGQTLSAEVVTFTHFSQDDTLFSVTHEWTRPGQPSVAEDWQQEARGVMAPNLPLRPGEVIPVYTATLPPQAALLREAMQRNGIESTLHYPVYHNDNIIGVLSVSTTQADRTWSAEDIDLLRIIGEIAVIGQLRHRTMQALRESEERFRQIAETINEVFFIRDIARDRIIYVSPAYGQVWGQPVQALYDDPENFTRPVHPDDHAILDTLKTLRDSGQPYSLEYRIVREDGSVRWIWSRGYPVFDDDGQPYRVIGLAEDITDRFNTMNALRESRERLQLAIETAHMGTWEWRLDSEEVMWGGHHEELFGMLPGSFSGTREDFYRTLHPDDRAKVQQALEDWIDQRHSDSMEFRVVWPDGSVHWMQGSGQIVRMSSQQEDRLIGVVQDITTRKEAEQQRIALRVAEERSQMLTEFLSNMSHDLRTPLSVIGTSLDMLERYTDTERRQQKIDTIRGQTQLLTHMIQDILTISRLDYVESLTLVPYEVNACLRDVIDTMAVRAERKGQRLVNALSSSDLQVQASPMLLHRALVNLVSNALRYTPQGGTITLRSWREANAVVVTISDTGIGIEPYEIGRIFERFYRVEAARSMDTHMDMGTGLGLAIVKRVMEMHRGTINVESTPGQGSTFRITLPVWGHVGS